MTLRPTGIVYSFFVTVHARPADAGDGPELVVAERSVRTLRIVRQTLSATTMECSFEEAQDRLAALGRMFCEPDGSFVWVSSESEPRWQVEGHLYDRIGRLLFVDLKGTCPANDFDRLLAAFGWPKTPLMFQLTREALFLAEEEFRGWAQCA